MVPTPFAKGFAITPSDTVNFFPSAEGQYGSIPACDAISVGAAGNVVVVFRDSTTATMAAATGQILPVRAIRVNATNTTATGLVALYWV